ncbi:MAG TPA: hypothetical protein PLX30_11035 [Methanothrix sp.]|nr:hypothetical protein [Methanothrix sp.]
MRTVADIIELEEILSRPCPVCIRIMQGLELETLEDRAEVLIAELQTTLTRIKELKAESTGSNLRRRSR